MNRYKSLFEGKFTTTHNYTELTLVERIYFLFSPTTVVLRKMFRIIASYKKKTKHKLRILDMGCGGGIKDLTQWGEVYGLDISATSIHGAKEIYKEALARDLSKKYPYKNEYFDVVFCSEVYGHILLKDKEHLLKESNRVLKKGGLFIFSCETKGKNWLTHYLQKNGLYKEKWVDMQGHIGLEPANLAIKRFKKVFKQVKYSANNTYIFTWDELATIFPIVDTICRIDPIRRFLNIVTAPLYKLSLMLYSFDSVNDILIYGEK